MKKAAPKPPTAAPPAPTAEQEERLDEAPPDEAPKPAAVPYRDPKTYEVEPKLREALAARGEGKDTLHVVVLGHVDAGKSTLLGRLIADMGLVDERALRKTMQDAQKAGRGSFGWAWAFDERPEERERGVTIDISMRHIETERCAAPSTTLLPQPPGER